MNLFTKSERARKSTKRAARTQKVFRAPYGHKFRSQLHTFSEVIKPMCCIELNGPYQRKKNPTLVTSHDHDCTLD